MQDRLLADAARLSDAGLLRRHSLVAIKAP